MPLSRSAATASPLVVSTTSVFPATPKIVMPDLMFAVTKSLSPDTCPMPSW
ncbi:hypothetical protein BMETH_2424_1 [methanotrophic bacterial endosymbiont of Bathymodiolus sp.]|nr:hypothetical protein BMETH_2424_1 [methanotrophic bacterial endosymbiont of Bathymodiolus sp.]